jgi:hypothetical protein
MNMLRDEEIEMAMNKGTCRPRRGLDGLHVDRKSVGGTRCQDGPSPGVVTENADTISQKRLLRETRLSMERANVIELVSPAVL